MNLEITCPGCGLSDALKGHDGVGVGVCRTCGRQLHSPEAADPAALHLGGEHAADTDAWVRRLAVFAAVAVLIGFLLPRSVPGWSGYEVIWFWQIVSKVPGGMLAAFMVAPIASIAVLILMPKLQGLARATTLLGIGACAMLVSIRVGGGGGALMFYLIGGSRALSAGAVLLLLCVAPIAAGNRLRRIHPTSPLPRYLAGGGGAMFIYLGLKPLGREPSLVGLLFDDTMWGHAPLMIVVVLGVITYGVLGAFHFMRLADPTRYCRRVTILGRVLLAMAPLLVVLTLGVPSQGAFLFGGSVLTLKSVLLTYGTVTWVAVGLVGWVDHLIKQREARGPAPSAAPEVAEPKTRLERLKAAYDDDLLTADEYEAKCAQIVESTEF